jgi:hypothetical protein
MTKRQLIELLEPYGDDERVVFVCFDDGIVVHEKVEVAKSHATTRRLPGGSVDMPVAVYLVDPGHEGQGVLPPGATPPERPEDGLDKHTGEDRS